MKVLRLFATLLLTALLYLLGQSTSYADDVVPPAPEQVVVSPAQAAVNAALATATTEVTQAVAASENGPASGASAGGFTTCPIRVGEHIHLCREAPPGEHLLVPQSSDQVSLDSVSQHPVAAPGPRHSAARLLHAYWISLRS